MIKQKKGNPFYGITSDVFRQVLNLSALFGNIFLALGSISLLQIGHQGLFFLARMKLPQVKILQITLFQICISLHRKIVDHIVDQFASLRFGTYYLFEKICLTSSLYYEPYN